MFKSNLVWKLPIVYKMCYTRTCCCMVPLCCPELLPFPWKVSTRSSVKYWLTPVQLENGCQHGCGSCYHNTRSMLQCQPDKWLSDSLETPITVIHQHSSHLVI